MMNSLIDLVKQLLSFSWINDINMIIDTLTPATKIVSTLVLILLALSKKIYKFLCWSFRKKPADSLYQALSTYSIASWAEVIYQIKCYRPLRFTRDGKSIRQIIRRILKCSGNKQTSTSNIFIVGDAACGKTTTMRYLYCKLYGKRQCVYFQMQSITCMEDLNQCLKRQKIRNDLSSKDPVVAFFDGLDEACAFFQSVNANSIEEAFISLFGHGKKTKVHELFLQYDLDLVCSIAALRPEFLEHSINSLNDTKNKNCYTYVYEICPLRNRDAIRIFKSLNVLKRLDSKLEKKERRHQERCPSIFIRWRYVYLFRKILKDNPKGLFHYPMYIRYAYSFLREYLRKKKKGEKLYINDDFLFSFKILLDAIVKWEFHVYYDKSSAINDGENDSFESAYDWEKMMKPLKCCAQEIAVEVSKQANRSLSRGKVKEIIQKKFPEKEALAVAHVFMNSSEDGASFSFCHNVFYEYFFAEYLFEKGTYDIRKQFLSEKDKIEINVRKMYYYLLCQEKIQERDSKSVNEKISASLYIEGIKVLSPNNYLELENQTQLEVREYPELTIVEIFEYLPWISNFKYHGYFLSREYLENAMSLGHVNMMRTKWELLEYAFGIISRERIIELKISDLAIKDLNNLKEFTNLKRLYACYNNEKSESIISILDELECFEMDWIVIRSITGLLCEEIYNRISRGKLHLDKIYVETPDYSQSHLKMWQLNQLMHNSEIDSRFCLLCRSDSDIAKDLFLKQKLDYSLLLAVFELETDENGILGLTSKNSEATIWNALNLARCSQIQNGNDDHAYQVLKLISKHIELHKPVCSECVFIRFGLAYGKILLHYAEYSTAKMWLLNSYELGANCMTCVSLEDRVGYGLDIYEAWIYSGETGIDCFERELEDKMKMLDSGDETDALYFRFFELKKHMHIHEVNDMDPKKYEKSYMDEG